MSEAPDQLLSMLQQGKFAQRMLESIEEFTIRERKRVERMVFETIESKDKALDPQVAVQAWIEIHTINRLPAKLRKQVRDGDLASKKIAARKLA